MESESNTNRRIEYFGSKGTVRYNGKLKHNPAGRVDTQSIWLGVEWDDPTRGNHDGTVDGVFYFACKNPEAKMAASLVKMIKANFGVGVFEAFVTKYFKPEEARMLFKHKDQLHDRLQDLKEFAHEQVQTQREHKNAEYDEDAIIKTSVSFKKIEFLGFQNIWQRMKDLNNLQNLSLSGYNVASLGAPGQLRSVFPALRELSLEDSLIYSWDQIGAIAKELPHLEILWLSKNRLALPSTDQENPEAKSSPVFDKLHTLILSEMDLSWKQFSRVKHMFPNLKEVGLAQNKMTDFDNCDITQDEFPNLSKIDLSENNISDGKGLARLSVLSLKKLNLYGNQLQDIHFGSHFPNITHLNVSKNKLPNFDVLKQLSEFKSLESLRVTDNPFLLFEDKVHSRLLIVGSVRKLKTLNGSDLKRDEKKDGEIYYLKTAFHDFFKISQTTAFTYDETEFFVFARQNFPLIDELIKKFGHPYPVEERNYEAPVNPNKVNWDDRPAQNDNLLIKVSGNFCLITFFQLVDGKEQRLLMKKMPKNIDIGYIKTFLKNTLKLKTKIQSMRVVLSNLSFELDNDLKKLSDIVAYENFLKIVITMQ
jgi:Leucine-rich repeat (LRR) protein